MGPSCHRESHWDTGAEVPAERPRGTDRTAPPGALVGDFLAVGPLPSPVRGMQSLTGKGSAAPCPGTSTSGNRRRIPRVSVARTAIARVLAPRPSSCRLQEGPDPAASGLVMGWPALTRICAPHPPDARLPDTPATVVATRRPGRRALELTPRRSRDYTRPASPERPPSSRARAGQASRPARRTSPQVETGPSPAGARSVGITHEVRPVR
jgi:hypothetical protein